MNAPDAVRWLAYARSDLNAARALLRDPDYYPRQRQVRSCSSNSAWMRFTGVDRIPANLPTERCPGCDPRHTVGNELVE